MINTGIFTGDISTATAVGDHGGNVLCGAMQVFDIQNDCPVMGNIVVARRGEKSFQWPHPASHVSDHQHKDNHSYGIDNAGMLVEKSAYISRSQAGESGSRGRYWGHFHIKAPRSWKFTGAGESTRTWCINVCVCVGGGGNMADDPRRCLGCVQSHFARPRSPLNVVEYFRKMNIA